MKTQNIFETGKLIFAKIIQNMAVWSSSYVMIPLRYGVKVWALTWHWHSKIMASTGVFVRVVYARKRSISRAPQTSSMILT
jgi:hypothetical protein